MTDDIVTRLREWSNELYPAPYGGCMEHAAEEIERLRALLRRWENCELVCESLCEKDNPQSFCNACKEIV